MIILIFGDDTLKFYALIGMVLSVSMYYFKLHPIIKTLDRDGHITPKGYSHKLLIMIVAIQSLFLTAIIVHALTN